MARAPESNLEIIFADWLDAMRRGDLQTMADRLAPDAVHQGVKPDWICRNREEVLRSVESRVGNTPPVDAIELIASGDHVVMSVKAPGVGIPAEGSPNGFRGEACIVFTLRAGKIVRMDDYLHRADALAAVGASVVWDDAAQDV
jgi:ketosteroid isomerase-like protein